MQRLTEFCKENTLSRANTLFQQLKKQLPTWASPDGQYRNQIDCAPCSQRWKSSIQSVKTRPAVDYGSGPEFLVANFRLKLKQVGETIGPFKYELKSFMIIQWKLKIDSKD